MTEVSTHTRRELARRSSDGIDVTLWWVRGDDEDKVVVCVCDRREGTYFEIPTEPYLALDVYYHPFAYAEFSTVHTTAAPRRRPMVEVGVCPTRGDAELAQAVLTAAGIPSAVAADGPCPFHLRGATRLLVDQADAEDAAAVLFARPYANRKEQR